MEKSPGDLGPELRDAAAELLARARGSGTLPVQGDSMQPTLRPGQLLAVEFAPRELRRGDVLLYRQNRELVVHRLLGRAAFPDGRRSLRTRGDGRNRLDPHLDPGRIVGRVTAVRDAGGWWGLRSAGARAYGSLLAFHALCWAAAGSAARACDRRLPLRGLLGAAVERIDRGLLIAVHRLLFRLFHSRAPATGE